VIEKIDASGRFDEVIARQQLAESASIANMIGDSEAPEFFHVSDEDFEYYVASLVDHTMESMGWPEDRRKFVDSDVRKLRIFDEARAGYCKHLVPLQDLEHTRHPATVYSEETNYTIGCKLLRHQTRIGVTDMELAIESMKATYCTSCEHREPGNPEPDSAS